MSQKTISARKLAANQANAQKSTGPRTEAGKQRSSQNSFKHGFYAAETVLSTEDPDLYYAFSVQWFRCFPPRDFEEHSILTDMIAIRWRFIRQCGIDTKVWEYELATQDKLRQRGNALQPDAADPMACLAYAFFPSSARVESNRQLKNFMRFWLSLLDRLKKLRQRPASDIIAPLPDELKQPQPPPIVTRPTPGPPAHSENQRTNPTVPEPPVTAKSESEANKPHPDAPPQQG